MSCKSNVFKLFAINQQTLLNLEGLSSVDYEWENVI